MIKSKINCILLNVDKYKDIIPQKFVLIGTGLIYAHHMVRDDCKSQSHKDNNNIRINASVAASCALNEEIRCFQYKIISSSLSRKLEMAETNIVHIRNNYLTIHFVYYVTD